MWCDTTKYTDEVSDEYVEAAGPIFKAGEVFDKEIVAADHKDAKGLVTLIIFPVSLTVLHLTWDLGNIT